MARLKTVYKILQMIMQHLGARQGRDILRVARTCKRMLQVAQSPLVWRDVDVLHRRIHAACFCG